MRTMISIALVCGVVCFWGIEESKPVTGGGFLIEVPKTCTDTRVPPLPGILGCVQHSFFNYPVRDPGTHQNAVIIDNCAAYTDNTGALCAPWAWEDADLCAGGGGAGPL